jgi:hypothetical protein
MSSDGGDAPAASCVSFARLLFERSYRLPVLLIRDSECRRATMLVEACQLSNRLQAPGAGFAPSEPPRRRFLMLAYPRRAVAGIPPRCVLPAGGINSSARAVALDAETHIRQSSGLQFRSSS